MSRTSRINLLDESTIGKIAAGEVIERPASVVKELVENALDAGARSIRVEIAGGGSALIRVSDDGHGIPADDLPLALRRYATSKLRQFDDLHRLHSFGFRGEALASVAAVAELQIVSRPADQAHATEIRSRYGRVGDPVPTSGAPGTTIIVRDLFANVPARRKFLRQDSTEASYVQRTVAACALAFPEVRFELAVEGKTVLASDGGGDPRGAVVGILGADVAAQMVPLATLDEDHDQGRDQEQDAARPRVTGLIGLPSINRGNRQQIFLFVNRRWIESRQLAFALEQAYHTLLMVGRFPIAVVNLDVPPDRVDVNVHPTKREVRFSDERLVFASLQRSVRAALLQHSAAQSIPTIVDGPQPLTPATVQRRLLLANPERAPLPPLSSSPATADEPETAVAPADSVVPLMRVLGQVGATYIIAEGPDGMYLIDQHAAHERVLLERLLVRFGHGEPDSQRLLEPLVVELSGAQQATLEDIRDELAALGFEIEPFGGRAVAIRAIPAIIARRDPRESLLAILDEAALGGSGESRFEAVAMRAACHAAIRAGQSLTLAEMRELILQLERCTAPRACAHGRPTMLHLSQDELERQFARR